LTAARQHRQIAEMAPLLENRQRIARLTPLEEILRHIEKVHPATAAEVPAAAAIGATLAQDIVLAEARPSQPIALIDGYAVRAEATADAGAYAPAVLPEAREVEVGDALPPETDAVAPHGTVTQRGGQYEAHQVMTAGDGVLIEGIDAAAGEVLRPAGARLRLVDSATLLALGIATVTVRRPRLRVYQTRKDRDPIGYAIRRWLGHAVAAEGGDPLAADPGAEVGTIMDDDRVDGAVVIGGTGCGSRDHAVEALAQAGTVAAHGIAFTPGETAAFGTLKGRPVLVVPGRLDAAVAAWFLIGRAMLGRLRAGGDDEPASECMLKTKVTSTVGLTELFLAQRLGDAVEPLASKYLPFAMLSRADGWFVVPATSEGLPPGTRVKVRPLP
jgi:molybdopterin molybdotransferase